MRAAGAEKFRMSLVIDLLRRIKKISLKIKHDVRRRRGKLKLFEERTGLAFA